MLLIVGSCGGYDSGSCGAYYGGSGGSYDSGFCGGYDSCCCGPVVDMIVEAMVIIKRWKKTKEDEGIARWV